MTEPQVRVMEPFPGFDVDDLGDFAVEHCSVTLAGQLAGGPKPPPADYAATDRACVA